MIMGQGAVPIIRNGVIEGPVALVVAPASRTRTALPPEWPSCSLLVRPNTLLTAIDLVPPDSGQSGIHPSGVDNLAGQVRAV